MKIEFVALFSGILNTRDIDFGPAGEIKSYGLWFCLPYIERLFIGRELNYRERFQFDVRFSNPRKKGYKQLYFDMAAGNCSFMLNHKNQEQPVGCDTHAQLQGIFGRDTNFKLWVKYEN